MVNQKYNIIVYNNNNKQIFRVLYTELKRAEFNGCLVTESQIAVLLYLLQYVP